MHSFKKFFLFTFKTIYEIVLRIFTYIIVFVFLFFLLYFFGKKSIETSKKTLHSQNGNNLILLSGSAENTILQDQPPTEIKPTIKNVFDFLPIKDIKY